GATEPRGRQQPAAAGQRRRLENPSSCNTSCVVRTTRLGQETARSVGQRGIGDRRSGRLDVAAVVVTERLRATLATLGRRRGLGLERAQGETERADRVDLRVQLCGQLDVAQRELGEPW